MASERLQKILSRAGVASRRHAEQWILEGKVKVNGQIITELGARADPDRDKIEVEGRVLRLASRHQYFAFYKPVGWLVTKQDEQGRRGIFERLHLPPNVNSVGRLDRDSEGLLLLTDDGDFIQRYSHPSFRIPKVYHVQVSRLPNSEEQAAMLHGVLEGEDLLQAVRVTPLRPIRGEHWIEIELNEGKKREIRRMLGLLEIRVWRLIRVQHGSVSLGEMRPGELKKLARCPR